MNDLIPIVKSYNEFFAQNKTVASENTDGYSISYGTPQASYTEAKNKEISISEAIADVKSDFEAMLKLTKEIKEVADKENDYGTSALVDEYISTYEKDLWMLNAYLK